MRSYKTLAALGALLALAASACSHPPPNVLLISIDSLRADHVGAYGYARETTPTIDALARRGVRFETAISSTSWTLPAHAALFTALDDLTHGVTVPTDSLAPGIPTLAQAMKDGGYQTLGLYSGPFLHPLFGLHRGFDVYRDCTSYEASSKFDEKTEREKGTAAVQRLHGRSHKDITNPSIAATFAQEIAELDETAPFFAFVHMWDVHYDYIPPEKYVRMFSPDYKGEITGENFRLNKAVHSGMPKADLDHILALYDGEIRYTDDTIARLLATLADKGLLDNTLVVVTSDHGDEFFEHGGIGHRRTLFEEVIRIPLIIAHPRLTPKPAVVSQVVSLTDIANTVLDLARLPRLPSSSGRSLKPLLRGKTKDWPERPALAALRAGDRLALDALRSTDAKIIHNLHTGKHRYFDLTQDPTESRAIQPKRNSQAKLMAGALATRSKQAKVLGVAIVEATEPAKPAEIDAETLEALRSLGYVDSPSPKNPASIGARPPSGGSPQ